MELRDVHPVKNSIFLPVREPPAQQAMLRQAVIVVGVQQREETNRLSIFQQPLRYFVGDGTPHAVAAQAVRSLWL